MFLDIHKIFQERLSESCWEGYKALGTKEKDGKTVPNCVPMKESENCPICKEPKKGSFRHPGAPAYCKNDHKWGGTCGHSDCANTKIEEGFLSTVQDVATGVKNFLTKPSEKQAPDPVNQLDSQKYEEYKKENDAITSKMSALNGQRDNLNKKINDLKRQQEELKKKYKLK